MEKEPILPSLISRLQSQREPMTVKELAASLRVSTRTIYDMIEKDDLPVIRIGTTIRLDPVHVAKWLRARQVK
jgi:excisionase family DNA binding protein